MDETSILVRSDRSRTESTGNAVVDFLQCFHGSCGGAWGSKTARTSDKNLERLGFTKYVRGDGGKLQKRFGKGPDVIKKPPKE